MKFIRYALALALLSSGGLFAATTVTTKAAKSAKYKKIEAKKHHTQGYHKKEAPKSTAKDRYGKQDGSYKKMEMKKHEKGLRKPTTKSPAIKSVAKDRPEAPVATAKANEPTMMEKAAGLLGFGAAGTAATAAAATQTGAGYHTGPRKEQWHHNFGPGAENQGFVEGINEHGHWVFAGYRPDWWEKNYPIYWKDVVRPLYHKSAEYQKTLGK